ncbi:Mitochondrial import inner membrane translocase subunit tim54 [Penicillium diatomitis]|uniref:Mitochondrial import inner membrane translocase subunit TIM54 n=1 Tax=Penicillium diatomitis TaxID=2819901 RepID=A0A9X0C2Z8_9EURO|nr:Mitochondrial import inner membrane translocase subunit tim54 [Penicillium diatomitis]KAJ5496132.1 Mitochondrial import inner membrane translocase subunit tim54 [Penicillium diatomitis]
MADSSNSGTAAGASKPKVAPRPPNPVFKMMGMSNIRLRLPSRNWMIFLTITGSFAGAVIYDRREKRRSQQKWYAPQIDRLLGGTPGDGLRVARDHFKEYVKPILTAAALDYTVVEGRREGEVRATTAESIRKLRRKAGEPSSVVEEPTVESAVSDMRERMGITDESGPKGDLVIGRHTWKEYVRGLHEGWLGPLDPPRAPVVEKPIVESLEDTLKDTAGGDKPSDDGSTSTEQNSEEGEKKEEKRSKFAGPAPAYISPADYPEAHLPPSFPQSFDSSVPIEFPHILGFLNTPIRLYRYLNQRHLAENIGREVAALVLASDARPYSNYSSSLTDDSLPDSVGGIAEQQTILELEEKEWHKSVHKPDEHNPEKEREWTENMVLDQRIASRMQRAILSPEDESRAQRVGAQEEYILGRERPAPVPFWQRMWIKYGYGEDEETLRRKPILPNVDVDGEDNN